MDYTLFIVTHAAMAICALTVLIAAFKMSVGANSEELADNVKQKPVVQQNRQVPVLTIQPGYKAIDENTFQLKAG